jgi:hypothetical protein
MVHDYFQARKWISKDKILAKNNATQKTQSIFQLQKTY